MQTSRQDYPPENRAPPAFRPFSRASVQFPVSASRFKMIQNAVGIRSAQLLHIFMEEKNLRHTYAFFRSWTLFSLHNHAALPPVCAASSSAETVAIADDKQNRIKRRQIGQNCHKRRRQPNRISDISHDFFISRRCMIGKIFQPVQKRRFLIRGIRHCSCTFLDPVHNPPFLQNIRLFAVAFPIPSAHAPEAPD